MRGRFYGSIRHYTAELIVGIVIGPIQLGSHGPFTCAVLHLAVRRITAIQSQAAVEGKAVRMLRAGFRPVVHRHVNDGFYFGGVHVHPVHDSSCHLDAGLVQDYVEDIVLAGLGFIRAAADGFADFFRSYIVNIAVGIDPKNPGVVTLEGGTGNHQAVFYRIGDIVQRNVHIRALTENLTSSCIQTASRVSPAFQEFYNGGCGELAAVKAFAGREVHGNLGEGMTKHKLLPGRPVFELVRTVVISAVLHIVGNQQVLTGPSGLLVFIKVPAQGEITGKSSITAVYGYAIDGKALVSARQIVRVGAAEIVPVQHGVAGKRIICFHNSRGGGFLKPVPPPAHPEADLGAGCQRQVRIGLGHGTLPGKACGERNGIATVHGPGLLRAASRE